MKPSQRRVLEVAARVQAYYFVATGLWPLVDKASFVWITGVQGPIWPYDCIGLLIAAIGFSLLSATKRRDYSYAICVLGTTASGALMIIDSLLIFRGDIGRLNLFDIALQFGFLLVWTNLWARASLLDKPSRRGRRSRLES